MEAALVFMCVLVGGVAARLYFACVEADEEVLQLSDVERLERCYRLKAKVKR
jgi:hypothetical protein